MHDPNDRSFLGHPRGLGYIAFAEAWERFSYYGMQVLLVLYMVHRLLLPGHVEHVAGFGVYHRLINSIYGNLSTPTARLRHLRPLHQPRLSHAHRRRIDR